MDIWIVSSLAALSNAAAVMIYIWTVFSFLLDISLGISLLLCSEFKTCEYFIMHLSERTLNKHNYNTMITLKIVNVIEVLHEFVMMREGEEKEQRNYLNKQANKTTEILKLFVLIIGG